MSNRDLLLIVLASIGLGCLIGFAIIGVLAVMGVS